MIHAPVRLELKHGWQKPLLDYAIHHDQVADISLQSSTHGGDNLKFAESGFAT